MACDTCNAPRLHPHINHLILQPWDVCPLCFHQKKYKLNKKNGNKQKITSRFYNFDKWSIIWRPLATWDPVTSYQSSYVSVLANILDFFNRASELCNHSVKSLNDSSGRPMVPMAAAGGLGREMIGKKKSNVGQHKWGKAVRSESGARSPSPWLELMATRRELI